MLGVATPLFLTVKLHKDTLVATGEGRKPPTTRYIG
jgi:hypothetical protein